MVDEYSGASGLHALGNILEETIHDGCNDVEDLVEEEGIREDGKENNSADSLACLDLFVVVLEIELDEGSSKEHGAIDEYSCDEIGDLPDV